MVLPDSNRVPRVPLYSGYTLSDLEFRLRGCHPLWPAFPGCSTTLTVSYCISAEMRECPTTRYLQRRQAITQITFGLVRVRSPLLAESRLIYFPEGTEMFQFPSRSE